VLDYVPRYGDPDPKELGYAIHHLLILVFLLSIYPALVVSFFLLVKHDFYGLACTAPNLAVNRGDSASMRNLAALHLNGPHLTKDEDNAKIVLRTNDEDKRC
jgi:hypothetical protein